MTRAESRTMPSVRGEKTGFATKTCASATFHHLIDASLVGDSGSELQLGREKEKEKREGNNRWDEQSTREKKTYLAKREWRFGPAHAVPNVLLDNRVWSLHTPSNLTNCGREIYLV